MRTNLFILAVGAGVVLAAAVGCQPEPFHERGGVGAAGAAGTPLIPITTGAAGAGGRFTGAGGGAVDMGAAGMGSAGGGGAGGLGMAGAAGGPPAAGVGGMTIVDAATGSDGGRADASDARALETAPEAPPSVAYASTGWKVTASSTAAGTAELPPNVLDNKPATRWTTGRNQAGNESFQVDFGKTMPVSRVVLDDTMFPQDFPVGYTLEVSTNGTTFMAAAMGKGAPVTNIQFATANARYVRIRQTGTAAGKWWSIAELTVYP